MVAHSNAMRDTKNTLTPTETLTFLFESSLKDVDETLERALETPVSLIATLALHLIRSGGKRLRPLLTLASRGLCGEIDENTIRLASAVELIHTATLLHDDVVDESQLRRGQQSANVLWGNASSILVGDFLFAQSFNLMVACQDLEALSILSKASATIAQGEVLQLSLSHSLSLTVQEYMTIIGAKTAELFASACRVSALPQGNIDLPKTADALYNYGYALGLCFQIVDDILDYQAPTVRLGKTSGDDFREGKVTLPVIYALYQATPEERSFWENTLVKKDQKEGDFEKALEILIRHNALERAYEDATQITKKALKALCLFPDSPIKEALCTLATNCIHRAY